MLPPRPLSGQPLAIDLINTTWVDGTDAFDLLDSDEGVTSWLEERALLDEETPTSDVRANLLHTRKVLRDLLEAPHITEHRQALNAILAHGRIALMIGDEHAEEHIQVQPSWRPAWLAARNLIELLRDSSERIKRCANPKCVLYFFDQSPKNTRRWHDMKTCGNRVKAERHYHRHHGDPTR